MITINYQTYGDGFNLRLRLYQNGETRFINVNKLLQGKLLKRHWNQRKQSFIPSAPFSKENNEILVKFKSKYDERAINWDGSLIGFLSSFDPTKDKESGQSKPLMSELFSGIVSELGKKKHPDGTVKGTYEGYEKVERRLKEYCRYKKIKYSSLLVEDITAEMVNGIFDWIDKKNKGKGYVYVSKMLHATMARAEKLGWYDMKKLRTVRWAGKPSSSSQKYLTLTSDQCRTLMAMTLQQMPKNPKSELYRDFCIFLLFTGQSPCDAIALKYSDIRTVDGVEHFIFKRRKIAEKQAVACSVPINDAMRKIMNRWKKLALDGYVFPIRNKKKMELQKTNNGDIKHFIGRLNNWLKKVGPLLGCDFPLHTYTFRHTAITNYISKGIPVLYVANMMGTSVNNCEKIYYNNQGDKRTRDLVLNVSF